jgi:hypothetical protein
MSPNCIAVDRIADVESAPEGSPLRTHVAQCPRCQSLWLSYQSFLKADTAGASNIEAARRELAATIRRKAVGAGDSRSNTSRMSTRSGWSPFWRSALVAAVVAGVVAAGSSIWRDRGSDEPPLRGEVGDGWLLQTPVASGESITFAWEPVTDAESYDVQIFDDALNIVLHSAPVTTATITVNRSALSGVASGATLTWRVRALRVGDVISTSPPTSLTLP